MSNIKRYLEDISVELGFGGEINETTILEGEKQMKTLFDMEIIDARENALLFSKAKSSYHKSFQQLLRSIKPLSDDRFWELLKHYRNEVIQYVICYKKGSDSAACEFFRKSTFEQASGRIDWTFEEALAFIVTYELKAKALYQPLFDTVTGRGDDGYGDLLDSLLLAGRETFDKCMAKKFFDNEEFEDFVKNAVYNIVSTTTKVDVSKITIPFQKHILNGENYNQMFLREQAEKYFVFKVESEIADADR